jgi:competence protein ComFB
MSGVKMIKNYMEYIVEENLPLIMDKYSHICKCQKCIDDIKAIALNNLKPLYVVTEKGTIYSKSKELGIQFKTDIISELTQAIEVVSKNPQHNF